MIHAFDVIIKQFSCIWLNTQPKKTTTRKKITSSVQLQQKSTDTEKLQLTIKVAHMTTMP